MLRIKNQLLEDTENSEEELDYIILKGKALIAGHSLDEGKALLESVLPKISSKERKNNILAEICEAEYELGNYDTATELSDKLVSEEVTTPETKGKIYRIKGLIEFFNNNNPNETIKYFERSLEIFKGLNQLPRLASMENNLGNMYSIIRDKLKASEYWQNAVNINSSIGNIEQQGGVLFNYGVHQFESCNFEKAIEQYQTALTIFKAIGDNMNLGIIYCNSGEAFLMMSEYKNARESLNSAFKIYSDLRYAQGNTEVLFMLGKLNFYLNNIFGLNTIIEEYHKFLERARLEKSETYFEFLKLMRNILQENDSVSLIQQIQELKSKIKNYSDIFSLGELWIWEINFQISQNEFRIAFQLLNSTEFKEICSENVFFDSFRNFLLGKIAEKAKNIKIDSPITYYEKAFEGINSISISELTLKILFGLYLTFKMRGQVSKMNELKHIVNMQSLL